MSFFDSYYSVRTPKLDCQLKFTSKLNLPDGQMVTGRGTDEHQIILVFLLNSANNDSAIDCFFVIIIRIQSMNHYHLLFQKIKIVM